MEDKFNFRVEKNPDDERNYILHVGENGFRRIYRIWPRKHIIVRGGDMYNMDELPPTKEEFKDSIRVIDCPFEVFEAFRDYTCGYNN